VLTQGAIISCLDKKGNKEFQKLIKALGGDTSKAAKSPHKRGDPPPTRGAVDPRIPKRKSRKRHPRPERPAGKT